MVRTALATLIAVSALSACGGDSEEGTSPPPPAINDEEVLAKFVDAERDLDAAALTAALGAGADLGKAADAIRAEWDAARKRTLGSLGPDGVVRESSGSGAPAYRFVSLDLGSTAVRAEFDFASMAWATWSLGLLYLGHDANGTVRHGPSTSGAVATTESTTVTAAKRGPVASVMLSTTRSQTSTAGWSVSQTGTVKLELPLCPNRDGVIAFDIQLELETRGTSTAGGTSSVIDKLAGHTVATVNDDARLVSVLTTGGYDHNSAAQGSGLSIGAGQSSIHVDVSGTGATATGSGNATDAQVQQARAFGASLLGLAGSLAAARAGDYYEKGYCTEIVAAPDDRPTKVAKGATKAFDVRVRHKWDNTELTDRITTRLEGAASVSPTGRTATPVTLNYTAPNEKNRKATIHVESRSRRGIALKDVAVKTPGGYAIHDVWTLRSGFQQKMDGVNCDSPYGPWHVVISGDLAAAGWASLNAYYDITADPNTGKGTVRGEEHSVTTDQQTYDGTSTGSAEVLPDGENYLIKLEIEYDIIWDTPNDMEDITGQDHITGQVSRELHVIPSTDQECP
jgi:hypothetical protein